MNNRKQPKKAARIASACLFLGAFNGGAIASDSGLLDFYDQALRTTVVGGEADTAGLKARREYFVANNDVRLRFDQVKAGSFSIELLKAGPTTLLASAWGISQPVPSGAKLEFWLSGKDASSPTPSQIPVKLSGADGKSVDVTATGGKSEEGWTRYAAELPSGAPEELTSVSLQTGEAGTLLDGVILRGKEVVGFTDKPLEQWMREIDETRPERKRTAFEDGTKTDFSGEERQWFDKLYLGQEIKEGNAKLREFFKGQLEFLRLDRGQLWGLSLNVRLVEMYYELGSKSGRSPAPLEPETEKLLLELLWERTKDKNDIGWASSSTWWMTASENHDVNAKVANLISSRIFMNEPDYKDRLYPDEAKGPGHGFWFHPIYGQDERGYGPHTSSAPWKPSGQHNAAAHYKAWVGFFDRYVTERTKRGFFLEHASSGYMKWTLGFLLTLKTYCGNEPLQKKLNDFFNVVWADWAEVQISGLRGGPKTRHHGDVGGYDSMARLALYYLGGPAGTGHVSGSVLFDDYAFDPVIVDLALDSKGRGRYEILSRGVGEAEETWPRPEGMERTIMIDRDARFLKYAWVTPDYILGTQMDHPGAVQSHLSAAARWHGLIVAGDPEPRIVPRSFTENEKGEKQPDMYAMFQTAQDRNVFIGQQARRWTQISPAWFPSTPQYEKPIILHVGKNWDETKEEGGWLFFRKGNAYAAVREIQPRQEMAGIKRVMKTDVPPEGNPNVTEIVEKSPQWTETKDGIVIEDKFSPFIIHAGSKAEHESFDAFRADVLKSKIELRKTVAPGYYILAYKSGEPDSREIVFSAGTPDIPLIDGKLMDYQPPALFKSPFIQSQFGSGKITIQKGKRKLELDFNW